MIICREQLKFFEDLQSKEVRIFNDSADTGINLNDDNKPIIREHFKELNEWLEVSDRWTAPGQWMRTWWLPVEREGSMTSGYKITINHFKGKGKEFISIDINRTTR